MYTLAAEVVANIAAPPRRVPGRIDFTAGDVSGEFSLTALSDTLENNPMDLLRKETYEACISVARSFDPEEKDAEYFSSDVARALARFSADREAKSLEEVEVFKKLFRICNFLLLQLAVKISSLSSGSTKTPTSIGDNERLKYVKICKMDSMKSCFSIVDRLFEGIRKAIAIGYGPLQESDDECQLLADQYRHPLFKFFELPITQYSDILCNAIFNTISTASTYHLQLQNIREHLVSIMQYSGEAVRLCIKLLVTLQAGDDRLSKSIVKGFIAACASEEELNSELLECLITFINEGSSKVTSLFANSYLDLLNLLEIDAKLTSPIIHGFQHVLKFMVETADEDNEYNEAIHTIIKATLKNCTQSAFAVRLSCLKLLKDFYQDGHAFMSRHSTSDLVAGITEQAKESITDSTALVRNAAMELFIEIMMSNPYVDDPHADVQHKHLNILVFEQRKKSVESKLEALANRLDETTEEAEMIPFEQEKGRLDLELTWLKDAITFTNSVGATIEQATELLYSTKTKDIEAIIKLLTSADTLEVTTAKIGLRKMLHLVWLKPIEADDPNKTEHNKTDEAATIDRKDRDKVTANLLNSYELVWLQGNPDLSKAENGQIVAAKLISIVDTAKASELTSLERLFELFAIDKQTSFSLDNVVEELWKIYSLRDASNHRENAAILLSMLSRINPEFADIGVERLILSGLSTQQQRINYGVAKYSGKIIQSLTAECGRTERHRMFNRIKALLTIPAKSLEWFGFAHECIAGAANIAPIEKLPELVTALSAAIYKRPNIDDDNAHAQRQYTEEEKQTLFYQMLYVGGEIMMQCLIYLDDCIVQFKKNCRGDSAPDDDRDELAAAVRNSNQAEMRFQELMSIAKNNLLYHKTGIFNRFRDIVPEICRFILESEDAVADGDTTIHGADRYSPFAQIAATTTLAKFMSAHEDFCFEQTPLLLALLDSCQNDDVRSSLVVAVADLSVLHSHVMEQYTPALFEKLQDKSNAVKRTTVVTLTFLILGGKVKVRGNLGYMARLLGDEDMQIVSLAKTFFAEYSQKDKEYFNSFMDILSTVATSLQLELAQVHRILSYLCQLVVKKTDRVKLCEKFAVKLRRCENRRTWDVYSFTAKKFLAADADTKRTNKELEAMVNRGYVETVEAERSMQIDPEYTVDFNNEDSIAPETTGRRQSRRH